MADTGDKVTRKYSNFRGVDFRGEDCSLNRSPDSLNVWRDYKKLASIETRPGLERIVTMDKGVKSMKWHKGNLYFVGGDGYVYRWNKAEGSTRIYTVLAPNPILFEFNGKLYVMGNSYYVCITDNKDVEPYIPTTSIGRKPSGGGQIHEDVNMLTPYRYNTFLGDGKSATFHLDTKDIDTYYHPQVWVNDEPIDEGNITVNPKEGIVMLASGSTPPAPKTDGQDNVKILFKKNNDADYAKIVLCTMAQEFDNRVFFSGNPQYPSTVWHSSLDDPSYFSDLDYYVDGVDQAPIRSMVAGNNALWVFRDESESNSSVFYHTPALDSEYGKVYPSSHSSISLACVGRAVNFNDDIVFFSQRGMEGVSTDITTEQFVTHRSSMVDRKMATDPKYKDMILAEWEGYLLVFLGSDVYLADSRAMLTNENHTEYEWYHWNFGRCSVSCVAVQDGVLYIAMNEGHIYTLTGDPKDGDNVSGYSPDGDKWQDQMYIDSYWTTPKDKFGTPNKLKTTNKKGCVVEAKGDVSVYAKVEDSDFELIGSNNGVEDYFVSRIKRKKFKDIQLKFQSHTGFCLESASLECFIGGYIKR